MKKVYQTSFYDPVEGTRGNCTQAVVASILNLPLKEVPPLYPDKNQMQNLLDFMDKFGYVNEGAWYANRIKVGETEEEALLNVIKANPQYGIDGYHIVFGMSPRGVHHVVIYDKNGLAHDPHPSQSGVKIHGMYWFLKEKRNYGLDPFS